MGWVELGCQFGYYLLGLPIWNMHILACSHISGLLFMTIFLYIFLDEKFFHFIHSLIKLSRFLHIYDPNIIPSENHAYSYIVYIELLRGKFPDLETLLMIKTGTARPAL